MPNQIFYVGSRDRRYKENIVNGYVPSKFLTIDGQPVVDPIPRGSQDSFIYSDDQGNTRTPASYANPNNYLIVPAAWTERRARDYANQIGSIQRIPVIGAQLARARMGWDFHPGGPEDLQRSPQWGVPENGFVPAYISSASHYLGFISGLTNTPLDLVERAGGHTNGGTDKNGPYGVSRQNHANLAKGYTEATPTSQWLASGLGSGSSSPAPAGRIGDGKGIAGWLSSLYGVDPSNPTQPVARQQTTGPLGLVTNQPMPQWPVPPPIFNTH